MKGNRGGSSGVQVVAIALILGLSIPMTFDGGQAQAVGHADAANELRKLLDAAEDRKTYPPSSGLEWGTPEYAKVFLQRLQIYVGFARAGLEFYDHHPDDPLRWDGLAFAYQYSKEYAERRREQRDDGRPRQGREEILAEMRRQTTEDPFLTSPEHQRILALVPQALAASDIDSTTYAVIAATRIYQVIKNTSPERMSREAKVAEARKLLHGIEERFPQGESEDVPRRHGQWSVDIYYRSCVTDYLDVLQGMVPKDEYMRELTRVSELGFPQTTLRLRKEFLKANLGDGKPMQMRFTALDGREVDLEKLRGKVVLVDFWATWCKPCIEELPNLRRIYGTYHDKGFEIVGVSLDEEKSRQKFVDLCKAQKVTWPQHFDGKGWGNEYAQRYGVSGVPAAYLLDKAGRVVHLRARGELLEQELRKLLELREASRQDTSAADKN